MLLRRLKLVNYGGIYNGMGLYEIEIDFSKCRNRIILIKGDNGTGKSTIEMALKPLPDDNTSFIKDKDAYKEIDYIDEIDGVIYSIRFIHECKNNSRISKGYFYKTLPNGNTINLNPSGNITSCKDMIYEELQLDANYITLTQLSSTKRGIADLRPADRKRYVNAILSSTDVYNTMYKNLSKRSSHYKSLMTNIASKIDSVGNITQLEQKAKTLDDRISEAESLIEQYTEVINKERGMLLSIDPDNEIAKRIQGFMENLEKYTAKRDACDKNLRKLYSQDPSLATISITKDMLDTLNKSIYDIDLKIKSLKNKIDIILENRQKEAAQLEEKTSKLRSINSGNSLSEIKKIKSTISQRKQEIEKRWGGIVDLQNITRDEFMSAYETIISISELVVQTSVLISENDINKLYLNTTNRIDDIDTEIESLISDRNAIESAEARVYILEQRPKNCKEDSCPFIADALQAKAMLDDILKNRQNFKHTLNSLNTEKNELERVLENIDKNKQIIMLYKSNSIILRKINLGFETYDMCVNTIKTNFNNVLSLLKGIIEYANDLQEYKTIDKNLMEIESKYRSLSSQSDLIDMISSDIARLNNQLNKDSEEIDRLNSEINSYTEKYNTANKTFSTLSTIYNLCVDINQYNDSIRIINEEIEKDKSNSDKIQKLNSDIEKLNVNISELKTQLEPLKKEREALKYKINLSMEYDKEYKEYNSAYSKIETLKYYCSPTTGIQLLFANMYLNKIMENANNILCKLFNGTFALLPLVITESEFRIPVAVNGGINHDDITSMSSAQISLISMIISISLLSQTSTKLNIIVGDEIDAPFDSENRREFINILTQLMSLVKSSQCVLISHNSEIPMTNCDIILLKSDNDIISEGNIIWSYK